MRGAVWALPVVDAAVTAQSAGSLQGYLAPHKYWQGERGAVAWPRA